MKHLDCVRHVAYKDDEDVHVDDGKFTRNARPV